jgi:hypothetical protein
LEDGMMGGWAVNHSGGQSSIMMLNFASAESTVSTSKERFKF